VRIVDILMNRIRQSREFAYTPINIFEDPDDPMHWVIMPAHKVPSIFQ
jgi:hypothetical protein